MFTRNDFVDIVTRHLSNACAAREAASIRGRALAPKHPRGRLFLTEYEIKKRLTADAQELRIPQETILSPLATDWIILKGIKVIRE